MSHLTQMAGLAVQNFVSAAVGIAVAVALDPRPGPPARGDDRQLLGRPRRASTTRILLPLAFVGRARAREPGRGPELPRGPRRSRRVEGATQTIPGGPIASQEAIKELGTNGGGLVNANSAHPFENPNRVHEPPPDLAAPARSRSRSPTRSAGWSRTRSRAGRASPRCSCSGSAAALIAMPFEATGNPKLDARRRRPDGRPPTQSGGNMEGKEVRFGAGGVGLFAASTTGTSTGSVNCDARQLHAARRRGPARQHDARRGQSRAASAPGSTGCWSSRCSRCSSPG